MQTNTHYLDWARVKAPKSAHSFRAATLFLKSLRVCTGTLQVMVYVLHKTRTFWHGLEVFNTSSEESKCLLCLPVMLRIKLGEACDVSVLT